MEKLKLLIAIAVFALLISACGGGESVSGTNETPSQPATISLSELSATVEISSTHQFNATVKNADYDSVEWRVNKFLGGNSTVGTISETGMYTAPDRVPSPVTVTVTATSTWDPSMEASATVTIMSNIVVEISPAEAAVPAGGSQQFTVSIQNAQNNTVIWKVNDTAGGDATLGTIVAGLYTAPLFPPPGGTVTISAASVVDSGKAGSARATVQYSNASFSGPYVFSFSGNDSSGPFYAAGRFVADGQGSITEGIEDFRQAGNSSPRTFTGSFSVQTDGRVPIALTVEGPAGTGTANFRFMLAGAGEGPLILFDDSVTGSGEFRKQNAVTFSNSSAQGPYVLQLLGAEPSGTTARVGVLTFDGAGNLSGVEDLNDNGNVITKLPVNGSYVVDANGRALVTATFSIGGQTSTSQTAIYLISSDHALGVPLDSGSGGGLVTIEKQQITEFSDAALTGEFMYVATGDPATDRNVSHGRLTADGAGTISAGTLSQHDANIQTFREPVTGSYSIPSADHGRGTASLTTVTGTVNFIFYLVSDKKTLLIGTDTSLPNGGQMVAQEGAPFDSSTYEGTYAFSLRGFDGTGELGVVGNITMGNTGLPTGTVDINHAGILTASAPLIGEYDLWDPDGYGYLFLSAGGNLWFLGVFAVDSTNAFVSVGIVKDEFTFGSLAEQFQAQPKVGVSTTY